MIAARLGTHAQVRVLRSHVPEQQSMLLGQEPPLAVKEVTHWPFWQTWFCPHLLPHFPQFLGSVWVLVQLPLQQVLEQKWPALISSRNSKYPVHILIDYKHADDASVMDLIHITLHLRFVLVADRK